MLNQGEIDALAQLAKLKLSAEEQQSLGSDLSAILELVETISSVSTDAVEPLSNPHDASAAVREDAVTEQNHRERFQSIAPQVAHGLYLVPKVIE